MLERSTDLNNTYGPWGSMSYDTYYVKTDEEYSLQYGDRTIEVFGDADILFDEINVEGYGVWVIRHHDQGGAELKGYAYNGGRWLEVS